MANTIQNRTTQLKADVSAASGITTAQKAAVQAVIDLIESYAGAGSLSYDLDRIYTILRKAF